MRNEDAIQIIARREAWWDQQWSIRLDTWRHYITERRTYILQTYGIETPGRNPGTYDEYVASHDALIDLETALRAARKRVCPWYTGPWDSTESVKDELQIAYAEVYAAWVGAGGLAAMARNTGPVSP